jgi:hypothetical protein
VDLDARYPPVDRTDARRSSSARFQPLRAYSIAKVRQSRISDEVTLPVPLTAEIVPEPAASGRAHIRSPPSASLSTLFVAQFQQVLCLSFRIKRPVRGGSQVLPDESHCSRRSA